MLPAPNDDEIVLENGVVRVAISRRDARIVNWTERATGLPLLSSPNGPELAGLAPDPGGFLAMVDEGEALFYDPFGHGGIAVQVLYRLDPEANAIEAEIALTNRGSAPIPVHVHWHGRAATFLPPTFVPSENGWDDVPFVLAGRTSAAITTRFSAFGELPHVGSEVGLGWDSAAVTLRAARPIVGGRLFLRTASGETLEAPASVYPERALMLPLGGVRPVEGLLRGPDGADLVPIPSPAPVSLPASTPLTSSNLSWSGLSDGQLGLAARDVGLRHLAAIERARRATESEEDSAAEEHLENALLHNADDPLTWWAKAGAQRRVDSQRDRNEWLNARYLRPLEPLVAAEALLAQEPVGDEGENPLMKIVAGREAIAAGCVAAYAEAGAFRDAISLGGRILAVRDWRRVRLLLGGLYLSRTRMALQAAEHFTASSRAESEGAGEPGPIERELTAALETRFRSA